MNRGKDEQKGAKMNESGKSRTNRGESRMNRAKMNESWQIRTDLSFKQ